MKVKTLEWDSRFFNKNIGVIEADEEIGNFSDIERFDLLYIKQKEDKPIVIADFMQTYAETKIIFSKSISKYNKTINSNVYSAFDIAINKEQIYTLAFESGKFSRFKLDNNFKQQEFEALYRTWVDNSFTKEFADAILVYKEKNSILGFITYKILDDYAIIGLLGVSDKHQGKGIGSALLVAVENELSKKQIKELRIPTQLQNKQACAFYTKYGYHIIENTIIKHFWKL